MQSRTVARAARAGSETARLGAVRASSSSAGPSTDRLPSDPSSSRSQSKLNPALRSLVELHHTSSTFLHDANQVPHGFENAFRHTLPPTFSRYDSWASDVHANRSARAVGGVESLTARASPNSTGGMLARGRSATPARMINAVWKERQTNWSEQQHGGQLLESERELRVKEALYGTWERGGVGKVDPALDGVLELVEAKGTTVEEYAREWLRREKD